MTWRHHAACIGMDSLFGDTMSATKKNRKLTESERLALAVCAGCRVRDDCLAEELQSMRDGNSTAGIFGGTTREQRVEMTGWSRGRPPVAIQPQREREEDGMTPEDEWDQIERQQAEEAAQWDAYWEGLTPEGRQREREMMDRHYEERSGRD